MAGRGGAGGIWALLDLIEEHRAALEYDFRARFRLGLSAVPDEVGWGEAVRLVGILRADPSTAIAAAMEGWSHPVSRETLVLMDLFDLQHAKASKKTPKPHPMRPWGDVVKRRLGKRGHRSSDDVRALLRRLGH